MENLLQSAMAEKLLSLIQFKYCILLDVIPFPNRTTLSYSTESLFRVNSGEKLSELSIVPVLPSPLFVSGFVAEFFTKVFVTLCCYLYCCILGKTVYALLCCPDEEFSLDPVVSLGNGIYKITGVSVEEEDFCNVSKLVISRKESVSAHSHIYFSHVFLKSPIHTA